MKNVVDFLVAVILCSRSRRAMLPEAVPTAFHFIAPNGKWVHIIYIKKKFIIIKKKNQTLCVLLIHKYEPIFLQKIIF